MWDNKVRLYERGEGEGTGKEKKKGDIWTSAEGRVQDANSEKTVTGENKYTGRVIV